MMRIVFFGSDDFAAICLGELLKSNYPIVGVVTKPDARQGRGMKMVVSAIKQLALEHHIDYLQPDTLVDTYVQEALRQFNADVFVVVAYGKILPQAVLDLPKKLCVNIHGSLLPAYRGAAPINWAIINGDKQTGVTIMKMNAKMDAGEIIAQDNIEITPQTQADQLRIEMAHLGGRLLVKTLDKIASNVYTLIPQDESKVSIASKLTKEMGKIDWNRPADEIERMIRGLKPWPGTYTMFKGKSLKILQASIIHVSGVAGTIVDINKEGFSVACAKEGLLIQQVHLEASKATSAYDFIQGQRLKTGMKLE